MTPWRCDAEPSEDGQGGEFLGGTVESEVTPVTANREALDLTPAAGGREIRIEPYPSQLAPSWVTLQANTRVKASWGSPVEAFTVY